MSRKASAGVVQRGEAPAGKRPSLQERKRARTRDAILSAAWLLLTSEGGAATTVRAVAELAEVSEMTVYNHFKNRAELIDAVVASNEPGVSDVLEAIDELGETDGLFDILLRLVDRVRGETAAEVKLRVKYYRMRKSDPELRSAHQIGRERATDALVEALQVRGATDDLPEPDLRLLCTAYSAVTDLVNTNQPPDTTALRWADDLGHAVGLLRDGWGGGR